MIARRDACRRTGRGMCLLLASIENLRQVNSEWGYGAGDALIRHVARLLWCATDDEHTVGRPAGNRLALALPGMTVAGATALAGRLLDGVAGQPLRWNDLAVEASLAVGIAPGGLGLVDDVSTWFATAESALLAARRRGPGSFAVAGEEARDGLPDAGSEAVDSRAGGCVEQETADRYERRIREARLESVMALVAAIEAKDPHTQRHSLNVSIYADHLARAVGLPADARETVTTAALLHDIGKIGIPEAILTKPGRLTAGEYAIVKRHPEIGATILENAGFLREVRPLVLHHHEWYDGGGYPAGLAGDRIPFAARLIHVADSIDAMLSPRSYRQTLTVPQTLAELHRGRGTQFDPVLADAAARWLERSNVPMSS